MHNPIPLDANLDYQAAPAQTGGSYSDNKLAALRLPPLSGKRVLDLGCNAGHYCAYALSQGAARVVGVDVDSRVIDRARQEFPRAEFHDTGWDRFPDGEFDVVILLSAIHYANDPVALAETIRTHLSPGGLFVLEGGLFDARGRHFTDICIPAWRQVGDRCRHLSRGFVARHLLRSFAWQLVGPSEMRGGDPVPRFVIHASSAPLQSPDSEYRLDLLEYATDLAASAESIVPTMPSHAYVRALGSPGTITSDDLARMLSDASVAAPFIDDVLYALGSRRPLSLALRSSLPEPQLRPLLTALAGAGIVTSVVPPSGPSAAVHAPPIASSTKFAAPSAPRATPARAQPQDCQETPAATAPRTAIPPSGCRRLSEYVAGLSQMSNNQEQGSLAGKVVADLDSRDPQLAVELLKQGVKRCYVVGNACLPSNDSRVVPVLGDPLTVSLAGVEAAFFDARVVPDFDHIRGVASLLQNASRMLSPKGCLFGVFQSGYSSIDFDVFNSIVLSPVGPVPSSPYLFQELLQGYAVRILDHPPKQDIPLVAARFLRLSRKQPTLLLVFAQSQGGKTSLARDFQTLDPHAHVSNDYVYFELLRLKQAGRSGAIPPAILELLGAGSGESCGRFNRALDDNAELLRAYLRVVQSVLPASKRLVTIDLDLRRPEQFEVAKDFFAKAGYSVWVVTR